MSRPWAGYVILVLLLIILSIIAFILSNIEGFLAGVIVIFMGFILSFFRDDLRRILGLSKQKQAPPTAPPKSDKEDKEALEGLMLDKLEKDITKEREKIEKAISKYQAAEKDKKKSKVAREIVERCTLLMARIDQAKSQAIQRKDSALEAHFAEISDEIQSIRAQYRSKGMKDN